MRVCVCVEDLFLACGCGNFWRLQLPQMCRYVTSYVAKAHRATRQANSSREGEYRGVGVGDRERE